MLFFRNYDIPSLIFEFCIAYLTGVVGSSAIFLIFYTGSGAFPARSQRSGLDRYLALLVFSSYDIESLCSSLHSPAAFF